jgi:hypothetical protein
MAHLISACCSLKLVNSRLVILAAVLAFIHFKPDAFSHLVSFRRISARASRISEFSMIVCGSATITCLRTAHDDTVNTENVENEEFIT